MSLLIQWGSKMKTRTVMLSIMCMLLNGCRTHEYCEYKTIEKEFVGGWLSVGIWSDKTLIYTEGRRKYACHGFPYTLEIGLSVGSYTEFSNRKFVLNSLTATGVKTGEKLSFKGGEKAFTRVIHGENELDSSPHKGFAAFRFTITKDMGVTYEPFDIEADVKIIYADGSEKSEHIKVRLEKDYKKKRQSDTWDFLKSV